MKKLNLLILLTVLLVVSSCTNKESFDLDPIIQVNSSENSYLISIDKAIDITKENMFLTNSSVNSLDFRDDDYIVLNTIALDDANGIPAIYIVNYRINQSDYFNIISADLRLENILAFGENTIGIEDLIGGLDFWVQKNIELIYQIRYQNLTKDEVMKEVVQAKVIPEIDGKCCEECPNYPECEIRPWIGCGDPSINCEKDPCEGFEWTNTVGPLMDTEWGGGCYYNDLLDEDCLMEEFCYRYLTGCNATAIAQVVNFHEHPNNYQYSLMLDNYRFASSVPSQSETAAVATLMKDAGLAVNMDWGCLSSTSNICSSFYALIFDFDYSNSSQCEFWDNEMGEVLKNDIDHNKPLILGAGGQSVGHIWVCDGYSEKNICSYDYVTSTLYASTYLFMHMNWGRDGIGNGFFGYMSWNGWGAAPLTLVIHNITP